MTKRKSPGTHLEWHGNSIRVVVVVPPSLRATIGCNKLKQSLPTGRPSDAERLKWPIIHALKAKIEAARKSNEGGDPLVRKALAWKEELESLGDRVVDEHTGETEREFYDSLMRDEAQGIEQRLGEDAAEAFVRIAEGKQTPYEVLEGDWLAGMTKVRTRESRELALRRFKEWSKANGIPQTVEAVTKKIAGRYVTERFERPGSNPDTANKDLGALGVFWGYLAKKGYTEAMPWQGQRLKRNSDHAIAPNADKRPFTDEEANKLLSYKGRDALGDMLLLSALSGMRISEIAALRVRNVSGGIIVVERGKSEAAKRLVPAHNGLLELLERRTKGKSGDAYLIEELPEQASERRSRAAPITQAFTRWRRKAGVDDRKENARQSNIDFHSWRRWFIRKAADALLAGAQGFSPWTLADVVGHDKGEMPLELTMGVYQGKASMEARRACVEAVKLPAPLPASNN